MPGEKDLLNATVPFGTPHTFTIESQPGEKGILLWFDGLPQGAGARGGGKLAFEELAIGARTYSHTASPPYAQGFFEGDIAEVLIYSRTLNDAERASVEKYLAAKYAPQESAGRKPVALETVANVPPVQLFVPGFTVRELPIATTSSIAPTGNSWRWAMTAASGC
jgi:hypothetical protein